jgi:hypothetical protein
VSELSMTVEEEFDCSRLMFTVWTLQFWRKLGRFPKDVLPEVLFRTNEVLNWDSWTLALQVELDKIPEICCCLVADMVE